MNDMSFVTVAGASLVSEENPEAGAPADWLPPEAPLAMPVQRLERDQRPVAFRLALWPQHRRFGAA